MIALWFHELTGRDRVSVKPHASPVLHAINYLLGDLDGRYLPTLRSNASYPTSRSSGCRACSPPRLGGGHSQVGSPDHGALRAARLTLLAEKISPAQLRTGIREDSVRVLGLLVGVLVEPFEGGGDTRDRRRAVGRRPSGPRTAPYQHRVVRRRVVRTASARYPVPASARCPPVAAFPALAVSRVSGARRRRCARQFPCIRRTIHYSVAMLPVAHSRYGLRRWQRREHTTVAQRQEPRRYRHTATVARQRQDRCPPRHT